MRVGANTGLRLIDAWMARLIGTLSWGALAEQDVLLAILVGGADVEAAAQRRKSLLQPGARNASRSSDSKPSVLNGACTRSPYSNTSDSSENGSRPRSSSMSAAAGDGEQLPQRRGEPVHVQVGGVQQVQVERRDAAALDGPRCRP